MLKCNTNSISEECQFNVAIIKIFIHVFRCCILCMAFYDFWSHQLIVSSHILVIHVLDRKREKKNYTEAKQYFSLT